MIRSGKVGIAFAIAASIASASGAARADDTQVLSTHNRVEGSPQNFALEFRVGPYSPRVDSDPALRGRTPYADTFGNGAQLAIAAELDWQVLRIPHLGTIGPGFGIGYTTNSGSTTFTQGKYAGQPSGETTSVDIFPMYLVAVLRADVLFREVRIPLVPYVKAGIGYALWDASTTGGISVSPAPDSIAGRGGTFGTQFAFGATFALDVLDPHSARELDNSMGINHTYIFAEYMMADLNGLGKANSLLVGTHSPEFGLAFEF